LPNVITSDSKRDASKDVLIMKDEEPFMLVPWRRYCWLMECENIMGEE
jgi:hypothetical protein